MSFYVEYDLQPQEFLRKLDQHITKRIVDKIEELLTKNPVPPTAKTIIGEHGVFRVRIEDYWALYRINYSANKIIIVKLDKRAKVYD